MLTYAVATSAIVVLALELMTLSTAADSSNVAKTTPLPADDVANAEVEFQSFLRKSRVRTHEMGNVRRIYSD